MASVILDGWSDLPGYIEGTKQDSNGDRLYDPLEFTFRGATRLEVIALDRKVAQLLQQENATGGDGMKSEMAACEFIASKLQSWNLTAKGVHSVPITAANVARLQYELFGRLYRIIRNEEKSDPRPPETQPAATDEELLGN
jgi:hypothetical protein